MLKTDVLETPQRIAQIIISWLIPLFGSLFVLYILVDSDSECLYSKWLPWPFRSIVLGKNIHSSNTPEEDYWAIERGGNHHGGRESEINFNEGCERFGKEVVLFALSPCHTYL